MNLKLFFIAVATVLLAGCIGSPLNVSMRSATGLKSVSNAQLCSTYGEMPNKTIATEIKQRQLFPDEFWSLINSNRVVVGMTKLSVLASWGRPEAINRIRTANDENEQWCFHRMYARGDEYVYFNSLGIVTAIQD